MSLQVWFFMFLLSQILTGVDLQDSKPDCKTKCGEIDILYPFGIDNLSCAMNDSFIVECLMKNTSTSFKPYLKDQEIVKIDFPKGEIIQTAEISSKCATERNGTKVIVSKDISVIDWSGTPFTFSSRNKLTATGCATMVFKENNNSSSEPRVGCSSMCRNLADIRNETCSGIGCCETSINKGLKILNVSINTYYGIFGVEDINPCSRAFLVEENTFNFNTSFIKSNASMPMKVQTVLNFAVDESCGPNSSQKESSTGVGNLCSCDKGYDGNPYSELGCTDIDECKGENNPCSKDCINKPGGYECTDKSRELIVILSVLSGVIFFLLFSGSIFYFYKKSKKIQKMKFRRNNFIENRILLQQTSISSHEDTIEKTKIFTLKELKKATSKFDEARIIGEGGHGTVYKGLLLDQRVVAIKMSKVNTQTEKEEYITEAALLSRTYHKNVVKLFGCCLESAVPSLVYEYIANGTLFDHLHSPDHSYSLCWDDRLRIATEVASAIVYILSASFNTIFHRDLKSANILLDEKLTAKLSDFGASKSISSGQTHITATVQGTIGYLDPEYYQSGKLTEKSDVYSFGVILLELLTGKKPIQKDTSGEEGNIIMHFIKLLQKNRVDLIFDRSIVEESSREELGVVAKLAGDCLKLRGEERPTMKEVEFTLEGIRRSKMKHKGKINQNEKLKLISNEITMVEFSQTASSSTTNNSQGAFEELQGFLR